MPKRWRSNNRPLNLLTGSSQQLDDKFVVESVPPLSKAIVQHRPIGCMVPEQEERDSGIELPSRDPIRRNRKNMICNNVGFHQLNQVTLLSPAHVKPV